MKRTIVALLSLSLLACGGGTSGGTKAPARAAESEQYFKALDARYDGDSRAYYDGLLELAHDDPDSRAGRKARAVLQADDGLLTMAALGSMAGAAIPNFNKYQNKSKEAEASMTLRSLHEAQVAFMIEKKRYCRTFKECGYEAAPGQVYMVFMGPKELAIAPGTDDALRSVLVTEARQALAAANVKPRAEKKSYLAAAVANLDGDEVLDIWTIDEGGMPVHVVSDLE